MKYLGKSKVSLFVYSPYGSIIDWLGYDITDMGHMIFRYIEKDLVHKVYHLVEISLRDLICDMSQDRTESFIDWR